MLKRVALPIGTTGQLFPALLADCKYLLPRRFQSARKVHHTFNSSWLTVHHTCPNSWVL